MANDINRYVVVGRLTGDANLEYTPGGMAIASFSIAVNHSTKKGDQWVDEANFFDVKAFGRQAENLKPYLTKGKMVGIDGYLRQDRWQDKQTGQNRSKVVIMTNDLQLLGGKSNNEQQEAGYGDNNGYGYGE